MFMHSTTCFHGTLYRHSTVIIPWECNICTSPCSSGSQTLLVWGPLDVNIVWVPSNYTGSLKCYLIILKYNYRSMLIISMEYFLYYIVSLQFNMASSYQFIYMIIRPLQIFMAFGRYPHELWGAMAPNFGKHHSIAMTVKLTLHLYTNPLDYFFSVFHHWNFYLFCKRF